jgi:uncharacterized membrane protein YccC
VKVRALGRSVGTALRPGPNPWAIPAAVRATGAAGLIAVVGAAMGDLQAVGLAYLGAACSVAFVTGGAYHVRAVALLSQAVGAAAGIVIGAWLPAAPWILVTTAAAAGVVSGMVGAMGPNAPGFGMMLSIGVAFGQFGGASLPGYEQALWYLVGTTIVAMATLAPWWFRRGQPERAFAAAVFDAAADLCAAIGSDDARTARVKLAAASAAARRATGHHRAELVAFAAASLYAQRRPVSPAVVAAIRKAGSQILRNESVDVTVEPDASDPGLVALADALSPEPSRPAASASRKRRFCAVFRAMTGPLAVANGVRIGLCLGVATAITLVIHEPAHAFWLPLTVAVIVRPEYASVFVRTVNRVCGTLIGATLAAGVLAVHSSGLPVAAAAAVALGFAVSAAPKLYGLSVIGITASALLSSSIGQVDPVLPALRLFDTVVGAAVAIVFGYLLWPGARRLPTAARMDAAIAGAHEYLGEAVRPPSQRVRWQSCRDDAYRLAHQVRAACEAATLEPPPVSELASQLIPASIDLEDVVDAITAVGATIDAGRDPAADAESIAARLTALDRTTGSGARWGGQL